MENSTVKDKHMSFDTFKAALDCTEWIEGLAWSTGIPKIILLSGGECTENPEIIRFIDEVTRRGWFPTLISNGSFLEKPELKAEILKPGREIFIQVGNDPRFYPRPVPIITDDARVQYKPLIEALMTLGRATHGNAAKVDIKKQQYPASFNLRSMTRHFGSIEQAMVMHRGRAAMGKNGMCSPNICQDGSVRAGETQFCYKIGTVASTNEELTNALINAKCDSCGLVKNLSPEQRAAINEN